MTKIGVIGCGHWGPNHIRVFSQLNNCQVPMAADLSLDRLKSIKNLFPSIHITTNYKDILANPEIDAVCVASPTSTHFQVTTEALQAGKHVLCEKPLALKAQECETLGKLASEKNKILVVGHIFLFNAGIAKLKEYMQTDEIGRVHYAHSERTNLGPFRYDVNALWDLAPHDIAIFNYLFDSCPELVSATGHKCLGTQQEDLAFATLHYPHNILVNIHVSWLDPKKVRQITIVGDKKMVVWDDLENLGPVKLYDKHVERTSTFYENYGEFQLLSREGSITIPNVDIREPLKSQAQYFLDCIANKQSPNIVNADRACDVVRTLQAISESMKQNGAPVQVK